MSGPLGRNQPADWEHVVKYPLAALGTAETGGEDLRPKHVPVALGINWYDSFDRPVSDGQGNYWVGRDQIGSIRGGHCVALEPAEDPTTPAPDLDKIPWWPYYNQGQQGSCVGHGCSRMMSMMNRKRYDALWLYEEAKKIDGMQLPHEGSTVRAGCQVLVDQGHRPAHGEVTTNLKKSDPVSKADGIAVYRWARTAQEVAQTLGLPAGQDYVVLLNSWGESYPERVRVPLTIIDRLLAEAGEACVVTDR